MSQNENFLPPNELIARLTFVLPTEGQGKHGLVAMVELILQYSVNTREEGLCTNHQGPQMLLVAALNANICKSSA